jgi:hypothetical protein
MTKVFDSKAGTLVVPNPDLKPEYTYNYEASINEAHGADIVAQQAQVNADTYDSQAGSLGGLRVELAALNEIQSLTATNFEVKVENEDDNFDNILISYSTEGLLSEDELISIAEKYSNPKKLKIYKFPYRRYSRIKDENKPKVHEIVVSAAK